MAFDPYHRWLGISPEERPADHYRLLSITRFESDPDVIESAADRQMAHVRTFQTGQHSALSQQVLNELSAAKLCLLDPGKRAGYDARLRLALEASKPIRRPVPVAQPLPAEPTQAASVIPVRDESPPVFVTAPRAVGKRRSKMSGPWAAWAALGVTATTVAVIVGVLISTNKSSPVSPVPKKGADSASRDEHDPGSSGRTDRKPKPPTPKPPIPVVPHVVANDSKAKRFAFEILDPRRARWSLEGEELVQSALDGNINIIFGDPDWEDFDFSVETKRTEGNDACGLRARYQDAWNAETYWLASIGNTWQRVDSVNDGKANQPAASQGSLSLDKWYRLELRMRGNRGQCFLDDEPILSFKTERRARGRVGLRTWDSAYRFRNILVKAPDGKVLLEGLPDLDAEPPAKAYEAEEQQMLSARGGTLPTAADGRPLNFDFETGGLQDWTAEGEAFEGQPAKGDTLHERYKYLRSQHSGQFWIGGNERREDAAKGTLTSVAFKVTHPYASFLVAGGGVWTGTAVELARRDGNATFLRAVGHGGDTLLPVAVDLSEHLGQEIFIRIVDGSDACWGRVSFDDFRFHETKPDFCPRYASSPKTQVGITVDLLKLLDIDRDYRGGSWHWDERHRLVGDGPNRRIELPLAAPREYDLALTVEGNQRADEVKVILPLGDELVELVVDGWGKTTSGLRLIDGKEANSNETTHRGAVLLNGEPNQLLCQVRASSIKVVCNGAVLIDWRGDPARLSFLKVAGYDGLLVAGEGAGYRISQLDLTPVGPNLASAGSSRDDAPFNAEKAGMPTIEPEKPVGPAEPHSKGEGEKPADPVKPPVELAATEAFALKGHDGAVTRVVFHPTLPLLASAGKDGRAVLWDLQTRTRLREFDKFDQEVWAVKFSPDGNVLTYANLEWWGSVVRFKNVSHGFQVKEELKGFKSGGGAVFSVAYSPDGAFFASGQADGTIRLWETATFAEYHPVSAGKDPMSLAFGPITPDRKRKPSKYVLAVAGNDGVKTLELAYVKNTERWTFDLSTVKFPKQEPARCARFSPDGKLLAVARVRGLISFFDPSNGKPVYSDIPVNDLEWVSFHPARPWIVAAHKRDDLARIWNYQTGDLLCELPGHTSEVLCAEFSRDGRHVATASNDFSIKLWDLTGDDLPDAPKRGKKPKTPAPIVGD